MTAQQPTTWVETRGDRPRSWPVPAALVALSAIPLAAGTLRLIQLAKGAGWVINLAVAEWAIRRPASSRPRRRRPDRGTTQTKRSIGAEPAGASS
jgi:hypothetical protein